MGLPAMKGPYMKRIILALMVGGLAVSLLTAQTPVKSTAKVATASKPALSSNEELNIQAYVELLRTDVNKEKSQLIGVVMQFDAEQAAIFWPIYKDFQQDLGKIGDQVVALVKNYAENYDNMTNDVADQLATKLLDIEQQRNELKKKYYERFKTSLDAITAARFLQVENQIEKLVDLQIASQLPVVNRPEK
jgi:hypothetical protein